MRISRKKLRGAATAIFMGLLLLVVAPVGSEYFIELAREQGLYDNPSKRAASMIDWVANISGSWWFALALGFFGGATLALWIAEWFPRREARASAPAVSLTELADAIAPAPAPIVRRMKPKPVFGAPQQTAGESYLSWWHIPITVEDDGSSPNAVIEHCTVELFSPPSPPIKLRWQADADPKGQGEIVLVEGMHRLVPIAIRYEPHADPNADAHDLADGFARLTGTAFLRDGNVNKIKLGEGQIIFKLIVRSGKKSWESPHQYLLRIPSTEASNGSFVLSVRLPA